MRKIREWYLVYCKNKGLKPTAQGLKKYYWEYRFILFEDRKHVKLCYPYATINTFEDFNKYPIEFSFPY